LTFELCEREKEGEEGETTGRPFPLGDFLLLTLHLSQARADRFRKRGKEEIRKFTSRAGCVGREKALLFFFAPVVVVVVDDVLAREESQASPVSPPPPPLLSASSNFLL